MSRPSHPGRPRLPFAPAHHCWSCGDPIEPLQAVGEGGVCRRLGCRAAEVRRRQAEDRAIEQRRRARARVGLRSRGIDPDEGEWSVVPDNDADLVPLTRERRETFLAYLERITREATDAPPAVPTEPRARDADRFHPPEPQEARALQVGCATCRGWCCRQGGTHAFLTPEHIGRLLVERSDVEPRDVRALYASRLGEHHLYGGCVFQGETGCRLPRSLRADRCNDHYCPDLSRARRQWRAAGDGGGHHFVAVAPGDAGPDGVVRLRTVPVPAFPHR